MIDVGHQEIISNLLEHPEVMKEMYVLFLNDLELLLNC